MQALYSEGIEKGFYAVGFVGKIPRSKGRLREVPATFEDVGKWKNLG